MLKKANITWSVKQYNKMVNRGTIGFDNAIQRGVVWDNKRKSLLIHSILTGYPIPPFYATRDTETKQYDMLDGKQRSNAICTFLNDEYALADIPLIYNDNGEMIDISGKRFSELDENLKDEIEGYSLTVYYFEDITDDEINEMFFRLNNGKALSSIELNRIKARSFDKIRELGQHDFLKFICTDGDMNKYKNEDIVIKTFIILTQDNPCLDSKILREIISKNEISTCTENDIRKIYDKLLDVYSIVKITDNNAYKKLKAATHLISIVPITELSIIDNISNDKFADFLVNFFSGEPTISDEYNANCRNGSNHASTIKKRLEALSLAYNSYEF